ncbi:MAG: 30S ribosomal protein S24e [Euryarchaeota archaeon]|nr:30S ribosomal protein S24e [Euryarchaeota archaeon]|tara:strand:+ start:303 stop:668 length:366 start_codon:yes stop_codon:yes gene_type:complete
MEIIDKKENQLLSRVEIRFELRHEGVATPDRGQLRSKVASLVPGTSASNVVVKEVQTRFGQPLTTGLAFIYDSDDAMQIEPRYVLDRHGVGTKEEASEESSPSSEPIPEIETEEDVSGGEE